MGTQTAAVDGRREAVMPMTRQYLIGELSSVLGELQVEVTDPVSAPRVARLRREVERTPVTELTSAATRGLELIDRLCRESLDRGDAGAFSRLAGIGGELRTLGVCAGLFAETPRTAWRTDSSIRLQPEVRPWQ